MSHRGLTTGAFAWILDFERLFTCTLLSLRACVTLLVPTGSWKLLRKKEFQWDTSFKSHCIPVCPSLTQTQMFVSVCVCVCVCTCAQLCPALLQPCGRSPPGSSVMGFSRQEYWSGLPFPSPGIFLTQGSNPRLSCLLHRQVDSLPSGKP